LPYAQEHILHPERLPELEHFFAATARRARFQINFFDAASRDLLTVAKPCLFDEATS
jgi:hypothetical protein